MAQLGWNRLDIAEYSYQYHILVPSIFHFHQFRSRDILKNWPPLRLPSSLKCISRIETWTYSYSQIKNGANFILYPVMKEIGLVGIGKSKIIRWPLSESLVRSWPNQFKNHSISTWLIDIIFGRFYLVKKHQLSVEKRS